MQNNLVHTKTLEFATGAAGWAIICVKASPWLFTPPSIYNHTIANHVNVRFKGMGSEEINAFVAEANANDGMQCRLVAPSTAVIELDHNIYDPWKDLFEFTWASLELHVERETSESATAVFVDSNGAVSRKIYVQDASGIGMDENDPNNEFIPWLFCQT